MMMAPLTATLVEVIQLGSEIAGVLDLPEKHWPEPGQYLPCQRLAEEPEILTPNLFKVIGADDRLHLGPLPKRWGPGDPLACLPPQGNGFTLPSSARRVGLLVFKVSPSRILTLVEAAVAQDASLSLFCDPTPPVDIMARLPSIVEVNPISALQENLDWPDYLAVDLNRVDLEALSSLFGQEKLHFEAQVLIRTEMPCRGIGECGVCAVKTQHGWRLTCDDGPVFPLKEVLNVAQ